LNCLIREILLKIKFYLSFFCKFKFKNYLIVLYSFFYSLFISLPLIILGYLKDKAASTKSPTCPVCRDIKNYGIHVFKKSLKDNDVRLLLNDFNELKKTKSLGQHGQLKGRIYQKGILTPLLEKYARQVRPHAVEYLATKKIKVEISYYQESFPCKSVNEIPGGELHVDDNKANLKYFIYLTNVNIKNGPFSCIPGTGNWRLKGSLLRGIFWELTKRRFFLYSWLVNSQHFIKSEKIITGTAGTNFLVDTTTLHRAHQVLKGKRIVAVISFNRSTI
jgi:hypothetical protein